MCNLTDEEVKQLKSLLPYAEQLKKEAKYKAAVRLILETWRGSIIFYSGLIAAVVVFNGQVRDGVRWILKVWMP